MGAIEEAEKHPKIWFRYFVAPSSYAKKATTISRNVLNVGLASLITALFVYGPHVSHYEFAFRDLPSDYLASLPSRSGDYRYISGGKSSSPRGCVLDAFSGKELACSSEFFHYPPSSSKATRGVAWVDPAYGVVRIIVDDLEILAPKDIQNRLRNGIQNFGGLISIFFICLAVALYRQISLVSAHQKRGS